MNRNKLIVTLFGASGDLAARKLYPAFYRLYKSKQISENFALIGTARREWSDDYFRQMVLESIQSEIEDPKHAEEFVTHFYYQPHDVHDAEHYVKLRNLADKLDKEYAACGNRIFYISLSPALFPVITGHLKGENLLTDNGYNRLIIEKPFGNDYDSACELQAQLEKAFDEEQIYRIDHYLGKGIVHSIYNLRFDNMLMKHVWNKDAIDNIQISLSEEVGVEDRGEYYESFGVAKDMIQNHALQLLALVAMEKPSSNSPEAIRQEKIKVLENLRHYTSTDDILENVVRGQYAASEDGTLPAYRDENNVANDSDTSTFFAAKVEVNLPQWEGVPFYIRSGKRMADKHTEINILFKPTGPNLEPNRFKIEIGPRTAYRIYINQKQVGYDLDAELVPLSYYYSDQQLNEMPADYERLIFECIQGNVSNFTHWLEVANAWKFVDNIIDLWEQMPEPNFPNYKANSWGPEASDKLLKRGNTKWV